MFARGIIFADDFAIFFSRLLQILLESEEQYNWPNLDQPWGRAVDFQAEAIWLTNLEKYIQGLGLLEDFFLYVQDEAGHSEVKLYAFIGTLVK